MIRLKSLLNKSLLSELEFGSQKAFDAYQKQHDLRSDTEVTVAGKKMSVGQAVKQSDDSEIKGSPVFGNNKGGEVFADKSYWKDTAKDLKKFGWKQDRDYAVKQYKNSEGEDRSIELISYDDDEIVWTIYDGADGEVNSGRFKKGNLSPEMLSKKVWDYATED